MRRCFVNLLSDDLARRRDWYVELFGWRVDFDSDWFVHLQSPANDDVELGILLADHDIVPDLVRDAAPGVIVTLVVGDVDELHQRALATGAEIIEEPRDLFYGQRRMLLRDPEGAVVDVSSECAPSAEFLTAMS